MFRPGVVKNNTPENFQKALEKAKQFADNHPEFTLYKGSLDIYNQQTDIDFTLLDVSPSGVAAGRYIADRYVATKIFNHSLDNSNTWYLGMNGYSAANPNNIDYYLYEDVSSNSFTYTTYFYKIRVAIPSGEQFSDKWVPWNPYVDGGLDYAVLGNNAPLSASITGPTVLQPYVEGTWTCAASGGVPPYSYSWYFMYPTNPLILKPVSGTWIHLGIDSPQLTRYDDETFQLKCVVTDSRNTIVTSNILTIDINGLAKSGSKKVDLEYSLKDNYPNPFNPTTNINYSIKENSFVSLKVYNLLGEEVANLVHKEQNKGNYSVKFNATNLPSGLYIYRLQARDFVKTKSMILLK
jgi:hypothetical protein